MERREFLKAACVSAAGLAIGSQVEALAQMANQTPTGTMPKRPYKNGIQLSVIGFGGILVMNETAQTASRRVAEADRKSVV